MNELHLALQTVLIIVVIIFGAVGLFLLFRAMRSPTIYYAPNRGIKELARELMCPRCGLRYLEPIGRYSLRCRNCGFAFNVGVLKLRSREE